MDGLRLFKTLPRNGTQRENKNNEINSGDLTIPQNLVDTATVNKSIKYQFMFSLVGLALGFLCIIAGFILVYLGVSGKIDWSIKLISASSSLSKASPGVVLIIIGFLTIYTTRFILKIKYLLEYLITHCDIFPPLNP